MANQYFKFKQFTIRQDKCAMKVGTDGVLLGAWTNTDNVSRVLDVGTGTGLIAIMLAQRSSAFIDAVEIDKPAYLQALENGSSSPWKDRLCFICSSFNDFIISTSRKYDLIISNPPYHNETTRSPKTGRQLARHSSNLSYSNIIESASNLLTSTGKISLILPAADESDAQNIAERNALTCTRKTHVIPSPGKEFSRSLLEFSRQAWPLIENLILIEDKGRHLYSAEYIRLTRDFYLNFI